MKLFAFTFLIALILIQSASSLRLNHNQGIYAWYTYDQDITGNQCSMDEECDGERYCNREGWCTGESRPQKNEDYHYDESITGGECDVQNENRDYFCDGNRTCNNENGLCQGEAR